MKSKYSEDDVIIEKEAAGRYVGWWYYDDTHEELKQVTVDLIDPAIHGIFTRGPVTFVGIQTGGWTDLEFEISENKKDAIAVHRKALMEKRSRLGDELDNLEAELAAVNELIDSLDSN